MFSQIQPLGKVFDKLSFPFLCLFITIESSIEENFVNDRLIVEKFVIK